MNFNKYFDEFQIFFTKQMRYKRDNHEYNNMKINDKRLNDKDILLRPIESQDVISDEVIINLINNYSVQTNCEYASFLYLQVVTNVCFYRPHLEKPLMKLALDPILCLGVNSPEKVVLFINEYILNNKFYSHRLTLQGQKWLVEIFLPNIALISEIFNELVVDNEIEFE